MIHMTLNKVGFYFNENEEIQCLTDISYAHHSIDECHQTKSRGLLMFSMKHGVMD